MREYKENELMLYQAHTDTDYVWTPTLCKRQDMRPVNKASADATMAILRAEKRKEAMGEYDLATDNVDMAKEAKKKQAEAQAEMVKKLAPEIKQAVTESVDNTVTKDAPMSEISKKLTKSEIIAMAKSEYGIDLDSTKPQPSLLKELKALSKGNKE